MAALGSTVDIYFSLKKERLSPQGSETASIAWQYSQLLAEFNSFNHQLDRAVLLHGKHEEINTLKLRFALLLERLDTARTASTGNNGQLTQDASPFIAIEALGKDAAYLAKTSANQASEADLNALRDKVDALQDKMATLSIAASRLSAEAAVQNKVLANRLENSVLLLGGVLVLLGASVPLALSNALMQRFQAEKNYRKQLQETEKTLSSNMAISMRQAHLLEDAQERIRLPLSGLRDLLNLTQNVKALAMLDRLQAAIDDSIEFALLNLGRPSVRNSEANLHALLDEVIKDARKLANEKNVTLLFDPMDSLPASCETDEAKLRKILSRLIHHAMEHSVKKRLNIHAYSTDSHGGRLFIDITDSGPDLRETDLHQGARHHYAPDSKPPYKDISLPLIKGLVRLLGGNITVINKPGENCIFTLDLPTRRKSLPTQLNQPRESKRLDMQAV